MEISSDIEQINIQMNRWGEVLTEPIQGQLELFPIYGKDYLLQMVVSVEFYSVNPSSKRGRFTLKPVGDFKLTRVPDRH